MIEKLKWDSEFFNYPVGRLIVNQGETTDDALFKLHQTDFRLIYVFSDEEIEFPVTGLKPVDQKVTLIKALSQNDVAQSLEFSAKETGITPIEKDETLTEENDTEMLVKPYHHNDKEYAMLLELALISGTHSRFNTDTGFVNGEYQKLYKRWIDESIKKRICMEILVCYIDNSQAGFVSISGKKGQSAEVGLIAVHPRFQGKGIGSILLGEAETYAFDHGFTEMQISTQLQNENSMKLYTKNGYSIKKIVHIYHFWN